MIMRQSIVIIRYFVELLLFLFLSKIGGWRGSGLLIHILHRQFFCNIGILLSCYTNPSPSRSDCKSQWFPWWSASGSGARVMVTDFGDGCRSDKTRHMKIQICYIDIYIIYVHMSYIIYLSEICHGDKLCFFVKLVNEMDKRLAVSVMLCTAAQKS